MRFLGGGVGHAKPVPQMSTDEDVDMGQEDEPDWEDTPDGEIQEEDADNDDESGSDGNETDRDEDDESDLGPDDGEGDHDEEDGFGRF
jgi:hypothetical protein